MMDLPICQSCGKVIEANEESVSVEVGKMRYHACGDFSITGGETLFFHRTCDVSIPEREKK